MKKDERYNKVLDGIIQNPIKLLDLCNYQFQPLHIFKQQKRILEFQLNNKRTITLAPRGASKSFSSGLHMLLKFFIPGYKSAIVSRSQEQANRILEIPDKIISQSPALSSARSSFPKDRVKRKVSHIGSEMVALPYDPDTIVGEHPHAIFIDEASKILDDTLFWESIFPMLQGLSTLKFAPEMHLTGVGGFQTGFCWEILSHLEKYGFKLLHIDVHECEGEYDTRENMGDTAYRTQILCEFLPTSSATIAYSSIEKALISIPIFDPEKPCVAGCDLARKRDKFAIAIAQPDDLGHLNFVRLISGQLNYHQLTDIMQQLAEEYKISSYLTDITAHLSFADQATSLSIKEFHFGGSDNKKAMLQDRFKTLLDAHRITIPNTFEFATLIDALKFYDLDQHTPDELVAAQLAAWNFQSLSPMRKKITATYGGRIDRSSNSFI